MGDLLTVVLQLTNETLTAATVVITTSLLLYNLTRNTRDRVAQTSSVVLASVTIAYLSDVFISLRPGPAAYETALRLQWLGIAFIPTATFHLSDALLATTGLPSRGRRRRTIKMLYLLSLAFFVSAAFSNILVQPVVVNDNIGMRASTLFPLYMVYFLLTTVIALVNIHRARQRCLTRNTRRRMSYLQIGLLMPIFGIFPYSVLFSDGDEFSLTALILVNIANVIIILMLLFLAYPLSFFGSNIPDRVVKTQLLRFVLRGPATGLLALVVIIFMGPTTQVLGLPGQTFMPFAVVGVVLLWQWFIHIILPWLEKYMIYSDEDDDQLSKLQNLTEQLLTRGDLLQLLDAMLASICDYLQVNTAFVVTLTAEKPEIIAAIGPTRPNTSTLEDELALLHDLLSQQHSGLNIQAWQSFWIVPLTSNRLTDTTQSQQDPIIGFIGIQARSPEINLTEEELAGFKPYLRRTEQTLDDLSLQTEIYAALEGLLPQISITRTRAEQMEYRAGYTPPNPSQEFLGVSREQYLEMVRAALRHYWGGPGLNRSRLLDLNIVHKALPENEENPARALRSVIQRAIENQRPTGERRMTSPEWTIYNILDLRFVEQRKVRDVAIRLSLAEATLYRKQREAIEAVADSLLEMESAQQNALTEASESMPALSNGS